MTDLAALERIALATAMSIPDRDVGDLQRLALRVAADLYRRTINEQPLRVLEAVSQVSGFPVQALRSGSRTRALSWTRQGYCFLAREQTAASLKAIGDVVKCDHTTVIHACEKVRERLEIGHRGTTDLILDARDLLT